MCVGIAYSTAHISLAKNESPSKQTQTNSHTRSHRHKRQQNRQQKKTHTQQRTRRGTHIHRPCMRACVCMCVSAQTTYIFDFDRLFNHRRIFRRPYVAMARMVVVCSADKRSVLHVYRSSCCRRRHILLHHSPCIHHLKGSSSNAAYVYIALGLLYIPKILCFSREDFSTVCV